MAYVPINARQVYNPVHAYNEFVNQQVNLPRERLQPLAQSVYNVFENDSEQSKATQLLGLLMRNRVRSNRVSIAQESYTNEYQRQLASILKHYWTNLNGVIKYAYQKKIEEDRKKSAALFQQ